MDRLEEWDAETVQDAVDVLREVVVWELSPQRWEHVAGILRRIDAAIAVRDADELRGAVAELELSGPVRILRIGSATTTSIPVPVLDRRNALVHALGESDLGEAGDDHHQQP